MKSSLSVPLSSIYFICTWLICTAETWAEHTEEWLGELGRDLQGPIESCCFFLVETIFWATKGKQNMQAGKAEHTWKAGHGRKTQNEQGTNRGLHHQSLLQKLSALQGKQRMLVFHDAPCETPARFSTWRMWLQNSHCTRWAPEGSGGKVTKSNIGILHQVPSVFITPH